MLVDIVPRHKFSKTNIRQRGMGGGRCKDTCRNYKMQPCHSLACKPTNGHTGISIISTHSRAHPEQIGALSTATYLRSP